VPQCRPRPDLIHRPGVGTSLGKAGVTTRPKRCNRSFYSKGDKVGLMERPPTWLGRVATSQPRSRLAARTCAGLDDAGAYRAIMICIIIRKPPNQMAATLRKLMPSASMRCMMTAILRDNATLAFFIPLRLASFIAQLFNAVQPLSGLVRMMLAAS
jgi:hypothetical protein